MPMRSPLLRDRYAPARSVAGYWAGLSTSPSPNKAQLENRIVDEKTASHFASTRCNSRIEEYCEKYPGGNSSRPTQSAALFVVATYNNPRSGKDDDTSLPYSAKDQSSCFDSSLLHISSPLFCDNTCSLLHLVRQLAFNTIQRTATALYLKPAECIFFNRCIRRRAPRTCVKHAGPDPARPVSQANVGDKFLRCAACSL